MKWARICASRPMAYHQQSAKGSPWTSNVSGFEDTLKGHTVSVCVRSSCYAYLSQPPRFLISCYPLYLLWRDEKDFSASDTRFNKKNKMLGYY